MNQPKKILEPDNVAGIISGLINGIILIVIAMALSGLIFTGPLEIFLPQGIGILLFGFLAYSIFSIFSASHPININTPQDIPIAIIALIAASVMTTTGKSWDAEMHENVDWEKLLNSFEKTSSESKDLYHAQLTALHNILLDAMKCKQTINTNNTTSLLDNLNNFVNLYFDDHGKKHLRQLN